ncbi:MAG TPA: ClpXP protease specificity-enhancing factor [Methylotenera sp.]|jgi:stringent starvation protein B|nr:ClpXP protease specificity-enhancing factor [Methylotenera sp.]HPV32259.1 ClpXP protease specificity-enhancing factor [Methylotenera sp.]
MTAFTSTKPYMIRAIHEWCVDNGCTPHLLVTVNSRTRVPLAYVKEGEIVLNLNYSATKDLQITNDAITFSARFGGISQNLFVPINAVRGIFARENGQGMFFEIEPDLAPISDDSAQQKPDVEPALNAEKPPSTKKPTLTIVK